jgi:hypothetical protein
MTANYNAIRADKDAVVWGTRRHGHVYHSLDVTASPGGVCAVGDRERNTERVSGFGKIRTN